MGTEAHERDKTAEQINECPSDRICLEREHGKVWDAKQVLVDFDIMGHARPLAVVMRKADSRLGSLYYQDEPRFYWGFVEDIGARQ